MKKVLWICFVLVYMSAQMFASGGQESEPQKQEKAVQTTVVIDNFNHTTTYTKVPERVIALSLEQAETLAALGLADKIISIGVGHHTFNDVLPEYRDMLKNKTTLEDKGISLEYLLSQNPDFIFLSSYFFNIKAVGTIEDYRQNNINMYISEGSYIANCTIANTYNDIRNLGKIFKVEKKAEELIASLQAREKTVTEKLKNAQPVRCFVFDSHSNEKYFTTGGTSLYNSLIKLAGGKNVFDSVERQFFPASIERIIAENPDVIIINEYEIAESGTHYENDGKRKMDFLKHTKELSNIAAIKNNKFIVIPLISIFPGIQNLNALEILAKSLHPEAFK
ncbi:MAG: ABC transporter substrate-binding protein [Treponema sp.]